MEITKENVIWGAKVALFVLFAWRPVCWVALKLMGAM